jgi:putative ABC transport system ATP-binding protein
MPEPILEFVNATVTFEDGDDTVRALTDVSFTVHPKTMVVIQGPSGCGKSTLLNVACGVGRLTMGSVTVCGQSIGELNAKAISEVRRRDIGVVFQRFNLVPSLSVIENVMLPLELDGATRSTARSAALEALSSVEVTESLKRFPHQLSGGQQQRVAIARAIVGDRKLLLADEPTASLDSSTGERMVDLLRRLVDERGQTVVLVTHESRYAAWANRIIGLRDGRISADTRIANVA